ncbi:hypothetical protein A6F49_02255 [Enteractinococcus helveticum]|uniref:Uncharacterized protein n=1 Tax=Enteractinococcus helveticum TaxID=1837282 RepID=A0A1B7LUJ5_9MICC|nr:hypothetical protein A6F49_02255 [Enteractinococcus helveticum]
MLDTEEVSDQFDKATEKLEFQDQLQTLSTLLQELGYQPELIVAEAGDISRGLVFKLPAGRSERAVVVDHNTIETILEMELQSWRSLRKYDGVWNPVEGTIEVLINERHGALLRYGLHRVPNASKVDENWASVPEVVLTDKESGATIRIGSMSDEGIALIRRGYRSYTSR